MRPDLPLAQIVAKAVIDQIEADACVNSDNVARRVFAELLYAEQMERAAAAPWPAPPAAVADCAKTLVMELKSWIVANGGMPPGMPYDITSAGIALERALQREGLL